MMMDFQIPLFWLHSQKHVGFLKWDVNVIYIYKSINNP